jgi:hypothetical protein
MSAPDLFPRVAVVCNNLCEAQELEQKAKTLTSEGANPRNWIGRIIMAVILGEAIWNLIVSAMNNLVVPWLGDVLGQSSGLPTSFTQRPYNYPDFFVSLLEFGIAGLVAAILNYFFQRPTAPRAKPAKSAIPAAPVGPARMISPEAMAAAQAQLAKTDIPVVKPGPTLAAAPATRPDSVAPAAPVAAAPASQAPPVAPPPAKPAAPSPPPVASPVAKPVPPAPKVEPPKPKKPKEVYYNIVGEPMPSDDD